MRRFLALIGAVVALSSFASSPASAQTSAQTWPTGNVKFIVPFAAGSSPDIIARLIGEKLQQRSGKAFIIENRPGASGNTGTDAVAKAPADGSVIGISLFGPMAMNTVLMKSMPYDPFKDIAPVTMLSYQPSVLAVSNELGVNSVKELVDLLKKNPGKYNYASILAVTEPKRSVFLPNVPTFAEAGIDGVEASAWNALIAPPGTPPAMLDEMHNQVASVLIDPELIAKFAAQMIEPRASTPQQLKKFVRDEFDRWSAVVKSAGIEPL
jgi:tripartite-type tricarboxylate transporter receptor subunit TctC